LYVVFSRPTDTQVKLLGEVLGSNSVKSLLGATGSDFGDQVLSVLGNLRKICNHPALFSSSTNDGVDGSSITKDQQEDSTDPLLSGKMAVLDFLLRKIVNEEKGRCVVVSQSTAMLDLISSSICTARGYTTVRIDGKCDVNKRQDVVDSFNNHGIGQIFLLSTTAGGAGLNLTGASRLILVDSHWNPALDQQAMARVWRDGQKSACVVYRLVTTGTLEEKVYQRQRAKGDIAAVTICGADDADDATGSSSKNNTRSLLSGAAGASSKNKKKGGQFSRDELKQVFTVRTETRCDTADVLGISEFVDDSHTCVDGPLTAAVASRLVSYVHLENHQGAAAAAVVADLASNASGVVEEEDEKDGISGVEYKEDDTNVNASDGMELEKSSDGASQLEIDDE
jgi:DNA repair and recombination protein RAD54B